jgi:hypothetical protein
VVGKLFAQELASVVGRRPAALHHRLLRACCALIVALVALHVADRLTVDTPILRLDVEANIPTWASSVLFALAGVAWAMLARLERGRRTWALLGALLIALSADEIATLHERLSGRTGAELAELLVQPAVGLAVIALFVVVSRGLHPTARGLLLAAAAALVLGHLAELATPAPEEGPVAAALKILEETFEMLLAALALTAAAAQATLTDPRQPQPASFVARARSATFDDPGAVRRSRGRPARATISTPR